MKRGLKGNNHLRDHLAIVSYNPLPDEKGTERVRIDSIRFWKQLRYNPLPDEKGTESATASSSIYLG